jgi:predicted flap endonuclease-1-like 5' DNA nuclease
MANYKISDIEGIGSKFANKLRSAGVRSVNALLESGGTRQSRKKLSEMTGVDESMILKWVNMADLYRVKGVGSEYSELLEKAGVDTIKELATRNADNLYQKMVEVNSSGRGLVRQLPGKKAVKNWVSHAKRLKPKITY